MTLQLQQAVNTTDIQEAIDVVTDYIRQNKHQALGRREKLEDETEGKNKDETLESLMKRNAELRSRNKANAAKIAELEAQVGDYIVSVFHLLIIIHTLTNPLSSRRTSRAWTPNMYLTAPMRDSHSQLA